MRIRSERKSFLRKRKESRETALCVTKKVRAGTGFFPVRGEMVFS